MKKEDIDYQATVSCVIENEIINPELVPYYEHGFRDGAEWRINSIWHDSDQELPELNKHVVNEDWFDFVARDEDDLKRIMKAYPFKRWAYVDDLKPTE